MAMSPILMELLQRQLEQRQKPQRGAPFIPMGQQAAAAQAQPSPETGAILSATGTGGDPDKIRASADMMYQQAAQRKGTNAIDILSNFLIGRNVKAERERADKLEKETPKNPFGDGLQGKLASLYYKEKTAGLTPEEQQAKAAIEGSYGVQYLPNAQQVPIPLPRRGLPGAAPKLGDIMDRGNAGIPPSPPEGELALPTDDQMGFNAPNDRPPNIGAMFPNKTDVEKISETQKATLGLDKGTYESATVDVDNAIKGISNLENIADVFGDLQTGRLADFEQNILSMSDALGLPLSDETKSQLTKLQATPAAIGNFISLLMKDYGAANSLTKSTSDNGPATAVLTARNP